MNSVTINIDPTNPGHFFASCGLLELLSQRDPNLTAQFLLNDSQPRFGGFQVTGVDESAALACLPTDPSVFSPEPVADRLRAVAPVQVAGQPPLRLSWWLHRFEDRPNALKGWGGQVKSAKLFSDLTKALGPLSGFSSIFSFARPTGSRFGVDPRSAWNPIDLGYSPNEQGQMADTFPYVELFAAFGLQAFQPTIGRNRAVRYHLWCEPLTANLAHTAAFHPWPGLQGWLMRFQIEARGQSYKYFGFARRYFKNDHLSLLQSDVLPDLNSEKQEEDVNETD